MKTNILAGILSLAALTLNAQSRTASPEIIKTRAFFETLGQHYAADKSVTMNKETIKGVDCYWFGTGREKTDDIIVYLHGGAFVLGGIRSHAAMVSHFAKNFDKKILFVDYALAPEHPFPAAPNEVLAVYKALLQSHPKSKIIFAGDSAGAALAVTAIHSVIAEKLKMPGAAILISPWINLQCNTNSYKTRQALDPVLTKDMLYHNAVLYAGGNLKAADPNEMTFKEFPPVFILVGTNEVLHDDATTFHDYISTVQKKATLKEYKDQVHVWPLGDISSAKSEEAMRDIEAFLKEIL